MPSNLRDSPQGTFTHAAVADYDGDGRLDIYFCLYSYYLGLDQYHYPVPYFDARNGPPNFLFHNEGNATFQDRTEAAGLNVDNDRYSFACAWGDSSELTNGVRSPDLYVANDFGRSNLYRNNGDGTFTSVSTEAGVEDVGRGHERVAGSISTTTETRTFTSPTCGPPPACGFQSRKIFHEKDPEKIRALYRSHARGNSLYRNQGNGKFQNVSDAGGSRDGPLGVVFRRLGFRPRWLSRPIHRQWLYFRAGLLAMSPAFSGARWWRNRRRIATPSLNYERGWNAINELVRSDSSWSGSERNVFYANNGDGTFSEVSGAVGLDFPDDSRSFVLADLDHDGRLEVILKNRNAPQLRVLRNAMKDLGHSIAFRLRGTKSNRDAIGAAVTVEAREHIARPNISRPVPDSCRSTPRSFSLELGKAQATIRATVRWPSGLTQTFENLPVNHRIEIAGRLGRIFGQALCSRASFLCAGRRCSRSWSLCLRRSRPG